MKNAIKQISNNVVKATAFIFLSMPLAGFTSSNHQLTYGQSSVVYTINKPITPKLPQVSGSKAIQYYATPVLPDGLNLDPVTGVISGTPIAIKPEQEYRITFTSSTGSSSTKLRLAVQEMVEPPTSLFYRNTSVTYPIGQEIQPNLPIASGGEIAEYTVTPALPEGLSLYEAGGYITGTPTKTQAPKVYSITGKNSAGSVSARIQIAIADQAVAPTDLHYLNPLEHYPFNQPIEPNFPLSTGGAIDKYSISPELPASLNFNSYTGIISGTPTGTVAPTKFTVTGINAAGHITTQLVLAVTRTLEPPADLGYATPLATYEVGTPITPNTPFSNGGTITEFSVSPTLPEGLTLDKINGVISGKPVKENPKTDYAVTGKNSVGTTTTLLSIRVQSKTSGKSAL